MKKESRNINGSNVQRYLIHQPDNLIINFLTIIFLLQIIPFAQIIELINDKDFL